MFTKFNNIKAFLKYLVSMKFELLSLAFIVLSSCSEDKLVDVKMCGRACFTGNASLSGVGACRTGTWECDDESNPTVCAGEVLPSKEVCDGQDNDCDGHVDDPLMKRECSTACGKGVEYCNKGAWVGCTATQPTPEACDRQDNDCDGFVDEVSDLPVAFCYTGPQNTAGRGLCMPGVTRCVNGNNVCWGEVLPAAETCDGQDNDCDGELDESLDKKNIDLVVIIDNSCSMGPVIDNVKLAAQTWSMKYGNRPEIRFGLLGAPGMRQNNPDVIKIQDLTNVANFYNAMALQDGITNTGEEPTLDALQMLALSSNPLNMSWATQSEKIAVVFSDEGPQSYLYNIYPNTVGYDLLHSNVVAHVFTSTLYFQDWSPVPNISGGFLGDIKKPASAIEADLDKIIKKATCEP